MDTGVSSYEKKKERSLSRREKASYPNTRG